MILAHRIQLDPTFKQAAYFRQACGTTRFVWNWGLAEWNRQYEAGKKPSGPSLKRQFNAIKYERFPWLENVHRDAHSQPFANLQKAFVAFFKRTGRRPRFKKRGVSQDSFYIANDRLRVNGCRVRLPIIGWVRMREQLRFAGKIIAAHVSREADRWFVSIQVEVGDYRRPRTGAGVVGVDLGVKSAVTLSDGEQIDSPMPLRSSLRRLRLWQRSLARKQKGSKNRGKQKAKVARVHARVRNIRQDWLHQVTTRLCRENQAVGLEDLCVKGMVRNHRLARAISDVAFGEFRRMMQYKSVIFGTRIMVADRFYPSSKTCSRCGHVKAELSLSERTYRCEVCGCEMDRDVNAARNLAKLSTVGFTKIYALGQEGSGVAVCGRDVKPRLVEQGTKPCSLSSTN